MLSKSNLVHSKIFTIKNKSCSRAFSAFYVHNFNTVCTLQRYVHTYQNVSLRSNNPMKSPLCIILCQVNMLQPRSIIQYSFSTPHLFQLSLSVCITRTSLASQCTIFEVDLLSSLSVNYKCISQAISYASS